MAERDVYQEAMNEAASAAWDQDWNRAVQAYNQALKAVPNDPQALAGLALALLESGDFDRALVAYQRVSKLVPGDPLPHEKMGEIFEMKGDAKNAAQKYLAAGETYFSRKDLQRAMPNWEYAVRLDNDLAQGHMRLAVNYERDESKHPLAIYEYLHVARLLQERGQAQRAEQALLRAQSLDPINQDVRSALDDLKRNKPLEVDITYDEIDMQAEAGEQKPSEPVVEEDELFDEDVTAERTLIEEAARSAMGLLADIIWTGEVPPKAQGPLLQGIDAHQVGDVEVAISQYTDALKGGLDHPALRFNLGVLYHYDKQLDSAIKALSGATDDDVYGAASHLIVGKAQLELKQTQNAAEQLILALRAADRQLNSAAVDESGYRQVIAGLSDKPEGLLNELAESLSFYLDSSDWDTKLVNSLQSYAAQGKADYANALVEQMVEGGRPELADIMEQIDYFLERNMLHLATDTAQHAVEKAPDYLPAHRRLADILIREARTHEAAAKINLIANTYLIRGNADKAADLFSEVIDLWPADTKARRRVIDMMRSQNRVDETLHHYGELADLHFRLMADSDKAIQVFNEALAYAEDVGADATLTAPLLKSLADIESQRLNWRRALQYLERVLNETPEDEEAAISSVDLYYQLGETGAAIRSLDGYIKMCLRRGDMEKVTETLEDQVRRRPEDIPLRQRLAEVYRQQGRQQEAIAQMDALGELQLDAGQMDAARNTIRKIVEMNPPDVEGYRQLLEQLEGGARSG